MAQPAESYQAQPAPCEWLPPDASFAEVITNSNFYTLALGAVAAKQAELYALLVPRNPQPATTAIREYTIGRAYTGLGEAHVLRGIVCTGNPGDIADSLPYFKKAEARLWPIRRKHLLTPDGMSVRQAYDANLWRAREATELLGERPQLWIDEAAECVDTQAVAEQWPLIVTLRGVLMAWQAKNLREKTGGLQ